MADKVFVELTLEERKALQAVQRTEKRIEKFGGLAEKNFGKASQAFNVFIGNIGARVVASAFAVLKNGLSSVVTESVEFDKALREISTILPKDQKLTDELKKSLVKLSGQFATSQAKQAKSFYQIISAGITDSALAMDVLQASNNLALGGLADLEGTIAAVTKVMNVYGADAGSATEITDVLFTAVKLGTTRVEDLAANLPTLLSLFKSLGLTFKDTTAALTTLTTRTGSVSQATTQLQAIGSAFLKNQSEIEKVIGKNALKTLGLAGSLKKLVEETKTSARLQAVLGGRLESVNGVLALAADGFDALNANTAAFAGDKVAGAAAKAAEEMSKALDIQWDKFIQGVTNAGTALFDKLKPALVATLETLNKFFTDGREGDERLKDLNLTLAATVKRINKLMLSGKPLLDWQKTYLEGLKAQRDSTQKQIDKLKGLKDAQDNISGGKDGGKKPAPADDPEVQYSKAVQAELDKIKEQVVIAEEEAAIAEAVKQGELKDAKFLALEEQIGTEQAIKFQARENLLSDEEAGEQKSIDQTKLAGQKRIAIAKAETKAILKERKFQQATQAQILDASLNAINAFGSLADAAFGKEHAISKALALARIPIFIAEGIAKSQTLPPPASWINAAAVAATGAAQLIAVKKSRFANSGVLEGSQTGDRNVAAFNGGEMFLDRRLQENMLQMLRNPAPGGSGGININIAGDLVVDDDDRMDTLISKISDAVEHRNVNLQASSVRSAA